MYHRHHHYNHLYYQYQYQYQYQHQHQNQHQHQHTKKFIIVSNRINFDFDLIIGEPLMVLPKVSINRYQINYKFNRKAKWCSDLNINLPIKTTSCQRIRITVSMTPHRTNLPLNHYCILALILKSKY